MEDEKVTSHLRRSFARLATTPENANATWRSMATPGAVKLTTIPTAMRFSSLGEAAPAARRIGIEACGGCARAMVAKPQAGGFEAVLFQPKQVRAYAMFRRQRANNDIIDAALIAACTAAVETLHAPPDPRFATLTEHLAFSEQIEADIARGKTRPAKDFKLPNARPRSKRKSRASKNAAHSSSNASSPFCGLRIGRPFPMRRPCRSRHLIRSSDQRAGWISPSG